jgi:hypothetical protein
VLREAGEDRLFEEADRYFGLPSTSLEYSATLGEPLYLPARSASI